MIIARHPTQQMQPMQADDTVISLILVHNSGVDSPLRGLGARSGQRSVAHSSLQY